MISLEQLVEYCMDFPSSTQEFPFDQEAMVFKVSGKMFALVNVSWWHEQDLSPVRGGPEAIDCCESKRTGQNGRMIGQCINVKCDPEKAIRLRDQYASILPVYHMSKKHWNTIVINEGELSDE